MDKNIHIYTFGFLQQWATFARSWFLIDARLQPPGKLATMCSVRLQGKHKPIYHALSECLLLTLGKWQLFPSAIRLCCRGSLEARWWSLCHIIRRVAPVRVRLEVPHE